MLSEQVDSAFLPAIRAGMVAAVAEEIGTAHDALLGLPFSVAGKTGSAQTGKETPAHAWFAGYAPTKSPEISIVVIIEHGGGGGKNAAPVAMRVVRDWEKLKEKRVSAQTQPAPHPPGKRGSL